MEKKPRVFTMSFGSVYPLYLAKAARKGRTREEVDAVIAWLTGYEEKALRRAVDTGVDLETFFAEAPRMNPHASLVTGLVCGVRVEEVADPLMRKIRQLDKLVDELARGKALASILRTPPGAGAPTGGTPPAAPARRKPADAPARRKPPARRQPR